MKIKDYYKLTMPTTKSGLKISGIILTAICVIIWITWGMAETHNNSGSIIDPVKTFIICFLAGNTLGLFITYMAFMDGFRQVRNTILLHDSIPSETKERYGLRIIAQPLNLRYNYLKIQIVSSKIESPLLIFNRLSNPDSVRIIIKICFDNRFQSLKLKIDKNYRKQKITLTGWGLAKMIKWQKKQTLNSFEIEKIINELMAIAQKENLDIEFCIPK